MANDPKDPVSLHPSYLVWLELLGRYGKVDDLGVFPSETLQKFDVAGKENTLLWVFVHTRLTSKLSPVGDGEGDLGIGL